MKPTFNRSAVEQFNAMYENNKKYKEIHYGQSFYRLLKLNQIGAILPQYKEHFEAIKNASNEEAIELVKSMTEEEDNQNA